jgi:hypothetical protein
MTFHKGKYAVTDIKGSRPLQIHISCRCNVKDVAVEVPVPDNTIPDFIIPSHIVVPRCTGVFLSRSNLIEISFLSSLYTGMFPSHSNLIDLSYCSS